MKYWITTHWPPTKDTPARQQDGVWLQEGKEDAGKDLSPRDLVFIYETKTGRPRKDGLAYWPGRQGLVVLIEISDVNLKKAFYQSHEKYSDGGQLFWKLVARTRAIDSSHFCHHDDVCDCLGYSKDYYLRGFGKDKSGLKELSDTEFRCLRRHFT